ncbi:hypothetical protein [Paenarthrobacter ureafaciens]|uniref:hypothetical protein n=1 Tax=Paenarthrobacter ureafaciens TaxID=37931 RepID=UPI0021755BAB|nr:hypothetical protein [Paenarthrobacter ureafaciens]
MPKFSLEKLLSRRSMISGAAALAAVPAFSSLAPREAQATGAGPHSGHGTPAQNTTPEHPPAARPRPLVVPQAAPLP